MLTHRWMAIVFIFVWVPGIYAQIVDATHLRGARISASAPANNQVLVWNAQTQQWEPKYPASVSGVTSFAGRTGAVVPQQGDYTFPMIGGYVSLQQLPPLIPASRIGSGAVTDQMFGYLAGVTSSIQEQLNQKAGLAHTHVLGGDLGGALNNAQVLRLAGRPVSGQAPSVGSVLSWNGLSWAPETIVLAGDVSGPAGSVSVSRIRGRAVASSPPSAGQVLAWNSVSMQWEPVNILPSQGQISISASQVQGGTLAYAVLPSLAGDVSGRPDQTVVSRIQGRAVANVQPLTGQTLVWDAYLNLWKPGFISGGGGGGSGPVTWIDILGNPTDNSALAGLLSGKAPLTHAHALSDLAASGAAPGQVPVWNGTSWVPSSITTPPAASISFSPAGTLSSTTVQAALIELDQEKAPVAHAHDAADIVSGVIAAERLGASLPANRSGVFLRGDGVWSSTLYGWMSINKYPATAELDVAGTVKANTLQGSLNPVFLEQAGATTGQVLQWNGASWAPGTVSGGSGAVSSVFGRTGAVIAAAGDYSADLILYTASGAPPGTTVQDVLQQLDAGKANSIHQHAASDVTSGVFAASRLGSGSASPSSFLRGDQQWAQVSWSDLTGVPATFAPSAHTHAAADLISGTVSTARLGSGTPTAGKYLRGDQVWSEVDWTSIVNKPATFAPSAHTHPISELTQSGASTGQVIAWNGSSWAPASVGGGSGAITAVLQTSSFTASPFQHYYLKANNIVVTLPAAPSNGDWVAVVGSTTGCSIARNGKSIMGLAEDMQLDPPFFALRLLYIASENNWIVIP